MKSNTSAAPRVRLNQLDGIKGIICFFIIFVHYVGRTPSGVFPIEWLPSLFVEKGWMFVELFFIISGFLCAASGKAKIKGISFKAYLLSRLKRLYPPALFALLLDIIVRIIGIVFTGSGYRLTLFNTIKSLTFTTFIVFGEEPFPTVVWYLHVLLLCYLLYFLIGKAKNNLLYLFGVGTLLILGLSLYLLKLDLPFLYANIGRGYFSFAIGLLIYEFQAAAKEKARTVVTLVFMTLSAICLILSLCFSFKSVFGDVLLGFTVLIFPTVMLTLLNIPIFSKLFSIKPLVFLGKLSMGIFLVHVPLLNLFNIIYATTGLMCLDSKMVFIFAILIILLAAVGWHYLIEKRLIPKLFK